MKSEKQKSKKDNDAFRIFSRLWEIVSDCIYPKRCIMCNCFTPIGKYEAVCKDCRQTIKKRSAVVIEPDSYYDEVIGAVPYEAYARLAMMKFKFKNLKYLGKTFGYCLYEIIKDRSFLEEEFVICPVPIHILREREYNQSEVVGEYISQRCEIELYKDLLIKTKNISPLSTMGYNLRRAFISEVFEFNLKYDIFGKNILLIDDIFTSGSTANECAKVLKMHGAAKVIVLAACHNEGKGDKYNGDATDVGN